MGTTAYSFPFPLPTLPDNALLTGLTTAQREAVTHVEGPLLILAGPGSGKTRVVTHRVAHLLKEGVYPSQILALTFTNKAADEMENRVEQLAPGKRVWMSTFHRFGSRMLREFGTFLGIEPNFTIYDTRDSRQVLRRSINDIGVNTLHYTPERIAAAISKAKNNLITADKYEPRPGSPLSYLLAEIYPAYQARLRKANAVDFDDLLLGVADLLYQNPEIRAQLDERYRFVLVDEYQDTNKAQYVILRALSVDYPNLAVTGDPDQSIYGWRGANLSNILEFESDYPNVRVVRLEQNYRSTQRILRVADQLISFNKHRKKKALFSENDDGAPVRLVQYTSETDEATGIVERIAAAIDAGRSPSDFAVFYRINALSRSLERAFHNAGVPFQLIRAQEFFQRKEIKDILGYCQLVNNPRDDVAFLRTVNTPPRGIGKKTLDRLGEYAFSHGQTLLEAAREVGAIETMTKRATVQIAKYVALIDGLGEFAHGGVHEIIRLVLEKTGYRRQFEDSESEDDINRVANIDELLTDARQFDDQDSEGGGLEAYLERLWLVSDIDDWDSKNEKVSLMTLHAAKGLEFPVVYIVAVEQNILPHERSSHDPVQIEEERRLTFVGITRAEEELQLSCVAQRSFRGQRRVTVPSVFLMEMPREEMDVYMTGRAEFDAPSTECWEQQEAVDVHEDFAQESPPFPTDLRSVVTTAAALITKENGSDGPCSSSAETGTVPPCSFTKEMAVVHPEYGPGKILALSGSGKNRRATVLFATVGEKRFILAHSPLQPASGGS